MVEQLIFELAPDSPPAFENFLPGTNVEAIAHLRALAAGRLSETSVTLWGAPGSGKSHLLGAVANAAAPRAALIGLPHESVDVAAGSVFVFDDVDRADSDTQGRLFTLYNACRDAGAQLLVAARVPPQQSQLRDDLRTRLGWGLVLELKPLADADKPAALASYANEQGFRLPPEVVSFLLSHVRRDMGNLMSIVAALGRHSLSTKRPVTVPLARELLQPAINLDRSPS